MSRVADAEFRRQLELDDKWARHMSGAEDRLKDELEFLKSQPSLREFTLVSHTPAPIDWKDELDDDLPDWF